MNVRPTPFFRTPRFRTDPARNTFPMLPFHEYLRTTPGYPPDIPERAPFDPLAVDDMRCPTFTFDRHTHVAPAHFRAKRTGSETFSGKLFRRFDRTPFRSTSHPRSVSSDRQGSKEHETPIPRNYSAFERPLRSIWFRFPGKDP
jgi:hypothetical protein